MAFCLSFICDPVMNLFKGLWTDFVTEKLSNITCSAKRVEEMEKKMKDLEKKRDEIEEHVYYNNTNNLKIPPSVPKWLEDVEKIKEDVDKISSNIGCFNLITKYEAGEDALKLTKKIDELITQSKETTWTNAKKPLGRVDSKRPPSTSASTSASASSGDIRNGFKSRNKIFDDALKSLQHDDGKTQVIALCGMGGVGKTTLMKQLKKVADDNKMSNWIVVVVVGKSSNLFAIQNAIAAYTGGSLTETDETLRATLLSKRFQAFSERKEKSLVILDDVWETIKLEDIGLASPLPNGVKLLLTSRDENICQQIAVDAGSVLQAVRVDVLEEEEARDFFCQIAEISAEDDGDLYEIGRKIVKKCGCLPLAIKIIAATVKCKKNISVWRRALDRLKMNDLEKKVQQIIEMSYDSLEQEDKAIFLLCGLFPEDSNIPIEDLTRYAWGLQLLSNVSTMEKARDCTQTSVSNLKNAYLLMDGDSRHCECVKMHDLVLAFVVGTVSKGVSIGGEDGRWIIHHEDDFSSSSEVNSMSQSCKQLSLTCKGMSEFPSEFQFPTLSLLKLMHGDVCLMPQDYYATVKNLKVIAFERMEYAFVPTSFQCSTNLRTLSLHECSLTFDLACIGNLLNLEVLSFANSGITILPSTFGNLKKLRLLDVTGCCNLVIDDGVLKGLVKLEELYMIPYYEKACCFTENNNSELAERSKNLCALEFEFIGNNAHMKNVSCKKLKRFKLSVGCSFTEVRNELGTRQVDTHSYENSLKLITNREEFELLKSMINELFKITDALYLQVNDMNTLPYSWFSNLRLLVVSKCAELTYLFTPSVATNLSKLEYLEISNCNAMEAVMHTENNGSDIIKFSVLKYLRLADLPNLLCFCDKFNVIELPRLMKLQLEGLPKITSIYPSSASSFASSDISLMQSLFNKEVCSSSLRSIKVSGCDSLVNLLPSNPMPLFNHLEELAVERCASIEVIFNIDMGCVGEMDKVSSSRLRSIFLWDLGKLREVWRIKDAGNNLIHGFEAVESILIRDCERFENIITPATTTFDMRALKKVQIYYCGSYELVEKEKEISKIAFPLPTFNHLHKLDLYRSYEDVEVVFEITSPISRESAHNTQQQLIILPNLERLDLYDLEKMSHVWKCNWNELILQKQPSQSSFHNLTTISMFMCNNIKYLFSPLMAKLLSSLKEIYIRYCHAIEEVVSNRDDEDVSIYSHTTASVGMVFPRLKSLILADLPNFVGFFLGKNEFIWPTLEEVVIRGCPQITVSGPITKL